MQIENRIVLGLFTMNESKELCCLCLSVTNLPLVRLFSISGDGLNPYNKISASLSQLATVINENEDYDYLLCVKCCDTIEMVYRFNCICLHNVNIFLSYRGSVKQEKPVEQSNVLLETNSVDFGNSLSCLSSPEVVIKERKKKAKKLKRNKKGKKEKCSDKVEEGPRVDVVLDTSRPQSEVTDVKNRFSCEVCGKTFRHKCNLNTHLYIHSDLKAFICDMCGKSFNQKSNLNTHMLTHTGVKPHICEICKRPFRHKTDLVKHKLIHSGDKPHLCDLCGKRFRINGHLVAHKRIHSGEKPYKCDVCFKAFSDRSSLIRHRHIHTGHKPYSCDICYKAFNTISHLNRHKKIHKQTHTSNFTAAT